MEDRAIAKELLPDALWLQIAPLIPRIALCGIEPKNRLGRYRWVVERTLSWLNRFQRLNLPGFPRLIHLSPF